MGQCGCGDLVIDSARPIAGTDIVLAVDEYQGCNYCHTGLMPTLHFFDPKGWKEWGEGAELGEPITPDEFGGDRGYGWRIPLIGKAELVKAARVLVAEEGEPFGQGEDGYATLADWLEDYGLRLLQEAMRQRAKQ